MWEAEGYINMKDMQGRQGYSWQGRIFRRWKEIHGREGYVG